MKSQGVHEDNGLKAPTDLYDFFSPDLAQQAQDYWIDAWQRSFLFLDVLRQRGNTSIEQENCEAPNVLHFGAEVLIDGRDLPAPVNYRLMRILPPDGTTTDTTKRPFVIFDPRAGQGPGVGGMKEDSEIGIALLGGHPVYFVSFLPKPVPGQTVEDVCDAEALFVLEIAKRHPSAEKPCLIGNCQAGWQIAMMSSLHPELAGVLILAGAPMSFWAGKRGGTPARYAAGMIGGSWINAFLSDLGDGFFDGAWLVSSFESNNPTHAYWQKSHNVYAKIDTEGPRYLAFERWWGNPILLDGKEMQFIADELFIGDKLATAQIQSSSGMRADLRNIKSPMVIFCSRGDEITSPAQALGWISELYGCDENIVASGQTIVYCLHDDIGHLGIFVSSSVATKEHQKFISNIDMIEALPPGLYEAVFTPKTKDSKNPDLISGDYILSFEQRGIDSIHAFDTNDIEDDRCFAAVEQLSETFLGLYCSLFSPLIRSLVTKESAEMLRASHPIRFPFTFFSDQNPMLCGLSNIASMIQENRQPIGEENVFWQGQEAFSDQVIEGLDNLNKTKNETVESLFFSIYGQPLLQSLLGLHGSHPYTKPTPAHDVQLENEKKQKLTEILHEIKVGGLAEAMIRGILYVSHADRAVDEREYNMLVRLRKESDFFPPLSHSEYKAMVRQQYMLLLLDESLALETIPHLLDHAKGKEKEALAAMRSVMNASGTPSAQEEERLKKLESLFVPAHADCHRRASDPPVAD